MKRLFILTVFLVLAALGGFLAWHFTWPLFVHGGALAEAAPQPVRPVRTIRVAANSEAGQRLFPATVQAANRADLTFAVDGVLIELQGQAGRAVRKGEVLARLDPRDFRNALDAAQAVYEEARLALQRTRTLRAKDVTTQSELDSAQRTYDTAEAQLRIQQKALEDTVLRAHYDGVVARRYVENHEPVRRDTPVISLQSLDTLEVVCQIPERIMARWGETVLQNLQVRFEADQLWREMELREVSADADPVTRTFAVVAALPAPRDLKLLTGMTAEVRLSLPEAGGESGGMLVPLAAVVGDSDGGSSVWVVPEEPGHPVRTRVELGAMRNDGVVILSGLQAGQRVAVAGVHSLHDGLLVRPMRDGSGGLD